MDQIDRMILSMTLMKHQYDYIYSERLKPYNLTFVQAIYMREIARSKAVITMSMLAKRYLVTRARVTTVLKGVRAAGYLIETPVDGRTVGLSLTGEGLRIVDEFEKIVQKDCQILFADFSKEEMDILCKAVDKAQQRLITLQHSY